MQLAGCAGSLAWQTLGPAGVTLSSVEGALGLAVDSNGVAHIASRVASSLLVQRFNGVTWLDAFVADGLDGAIISLDLAVNPANQPVCAVASATSVSLFRG